VRACRSASLSPSVYTLYIKYTYKIHCSSFNALTVPVRFVCIIFYRRRKKILQPAAADDFLILYKLVDYKLAYYYYYRTTIPPPQTDCIHVCVCVCVCVRAVSDFCRRRLFVNTTQTQYNNNNKLLSFRPWPRTRGIVIIVYWFYSDVVFFLFKNGFT